MAALTGTNVVGNLWKVGEQYTALGVYTLVGAITNADTITWDNLLPEGDKTITGFTIYGQELDTNASPTLAIIVGDENDADGYLASATAGSANAQFALRGTGAYLNNTTAKTTGRDVIITTSGTLGTAASTGTVFVAVTYVCGAV